MDLDGATTPESARAAEKKKRNKSGPLESLKATQTKKQNKGKQAQSPTISRTSRKPSFPEPLPPQLYLNL